ncbi:MAG: hypothetical protein RL346_1228 [Verrucomicrobiota bacterium]|jgi:hypothetical protein
MAARKTAQREPCAFERAVNFQRLDAIMAAGGIVPAHPIAARQETQPWRDPELIKAYDEDKEFGHRVLYASVPKRLIEKFRKGFRIGQKC